MAALVQASGRTAFTPSQKLLDLHELHRSYSSFAQFQPELPGLLHQASLLDECITLTRALGILEPLTEEHIPPEALLIKGPNLRESIIGNGLLSRNRATLAVLERIYGSLEVLRDKDVYLVEALTGFALWLRRQLGHEQVVCSEYLLDSEDSFPDIPHQDLCELSFSSNSMDILLCNELFEHLPDLEQAASEIARVLRLGGRLLATCPMAFGQNDSIVKALFDPRSGETQIFGEPELHGDPVRPEKGSLVFRIPGWDILDQLKRAGMARAQIHHVASWKYGILGSDLPGVLVIEAQK